MPGEHKLVAALLEEKRLSLHETHFEFAKRLYPKRRQKSAASHYSQIANGKVDFPKSLLPQAAKILGIPVKKLSTY